jgi:hypothetical protein
LPQALSLKIRFPESHRSEPRCISKNHAPERLA